ncbi:uncharacterized protein LOC129601648 [Paramacrobiotus metropolitanus]|uniref:uncharacterized protein LOC129601648 n=1 Tax=Paramacrobiotus metropolitanus TaxID=2943436 RepID=UPI0024464AE0|nr:uncharacterized protein LOC129601648 [Paramacrobiotus metropolitanus]
MQFFPLILGFASLVLGDTGGSSGSSGSGGAANGQVQLNSQQATVLDNGSHNSVGQSQSLVSGTTLNIGGSSSSSLQYDPSVTANPASAFGSNYVNANGNAMTGVLQNNQNSQSNSTSDGQHHSVISQSQVNGNGTGISVSNSASGSVYLRLPTTTPRYITTTGCSYSGLTCYGAGCVPINSGPDSCWCSCWSVSTPHYITDTTYPATATPSPLAVANGSRVDQRQRRPSGGSIIRNGHNILKSREKLPSRGKEQAQVGHTTLPRNFRKKA